MPCGGAHSSLGSANHDQPRTCVVHGMETALSTSNKTQNAAFMPLTGSTNRLFAPNCSRTERVNGNLADFIPCQPISTPQCCLIWSKTPLPWCWLALTGLGRGVFGRYWGQNKAAGSSSRHSKGGRAQPSPGSSKPASEEETLTQYTARPVQMTETGVMGYPAIPRTTSG
jgi:hypothetical protein